MSTSHSRFPTDLIVQILHWSWLVTMSLFVGLQYYALTDMVDRDRDDSSLRYFQMLDARVNELSDLTEALQARPEPITAASVQALSDSLEARLNRLEQTSDLSAALDELQAQLQSLRTELDQLKIRQTAPASPITARALPARPTVRPPLPFRVVGSETRAGQHSLAVAPSTGQLSADQIQIVLPGEAVGQWQLHAIEGDTAVFHAGKQVRRLKIP